MIGLKELADGVQALQAKLQGKDLALGMDRRDYIATAIYSSLIVSELGEKEGVAERAAVVGAEALIKELDRDD